MPITPTYPGVYIEEIPSNSHTITPAPTAIGAFIGYSHPFKTENFGDAVRLFSFADYEREFGGFFSSHAYEAESTYFGDLAHSVSQFFLNGGSTCYVVGLKPKFTDASGTVEIGRPAGSLDLNSGVIDFEGLEPTDSSEIKLEFSNFSDSDFDTNDVADLVVTHGTTVETYRQVNLSDGGTNNEIFNSNDIKARINDVSGLIRIKSVGGDEFNTANTSLTLTTSPNKAAYKLDGLVNTLSVQALVATVDAVESIVLTFAFFADGGSDTEPNITIAYTHTDDTDTVVTTTENYAAVALSAIQATINGNSKLIWVGVPPEGAAYDISETTLPVKGRLFNADNFTGVFAAESELDKVPIFNIMVLPGVQDDAVLGSAIAFCERAMAFIILDPAMDDDPVQVGDDMESGVPRSANGAFFYPYIKSPKPGTTDYEAPPSGTVAGIFARTDVKRGVWKSPAGLETTILGTTGVVDRGVMTDPRQGVLNGLGVNCLRDFPNIGTVVYGSRTLVSANPSYEQWRYIAVRRMALFIEQTMLRNLTWAVFEPNAEPLWDALRISVENFMSGLFSQNAFKGVKPSDAFEVICDNTTTTQSDIDNGRVYIVIKFAPLKPAEFVIVRIGQLAGQTQS